MLSRRQPKPKRDGERGGRRGAWRVPESPPASLQSAPRPRGSRRRRLCLPHAPPAASSPSGVHAARSYCASLKRKKKKQSQNRLYGVRAPTNRFRDGSISADPTLAFILPLTDFICKCFAANLSYMEKQLRTIERRSLQPAVYREGKGRKGVGRSCYYTVFRCPEGSTAPAEAGAGSGACRRVGPGRAGSARRERRGAWCRAPARLPSVLRLPTAVCSFPLFLTLVSSSWLSPWPRVCVFPQSHAAVRAARDFLREISRSSTRLTLTDLRDSSVLYGFS